MAGKKRIFIVEDEPIVANDLKLTLKQYGYEVIDIANTAVEAIEIALRDRPDIILMDIKIKGEMTGIQAAMKIREHYSVPILYLTAYSDAETLDQAKITEPAAFILKPFNERELISNIEMGLFRHEMEHRLQVLHSWYEGTLKSIDKAIFCSDKDDLIIFVNPMAKRISGWSEEDLLQKPVELFLKIRNALTDRSILDSFSPLSEEPNRRNVIDTYLLTPKSGGEIPIMYHSSNILDNNGQILGKLHLIEDISQSKRIEAEIDIRRAEIQLQRANTMLTNMNILTSGVFGTLTKDQHMVIEVLNQTAQDLYHQAKRWKYRLNIENVVGLDSYIKTDLNGLVERIVDDLYETISCKAIELDIRLKPDQITLITHPDLIFYSLYTMLELFIEHLPERSVLHLEITHDDQFIGVKIRTDDYNTIPIQYLENSISIETIDIVEKIEQAHNFFFVKKLIKYHNGLLVIESEVNTKAIMQFPHFKGKV